MLVEGGWGDIHIYIDTQSVRTQKVEDKSVTMSGKDAKSVAQGCHAPRWNEQNRQEL